MNKQQSIINKFIRGVNTDIAEDTLEDGFLTNGHNIKLTNDDNKQGIVQKQEGYISKLNGYPSNLKPLAAMDFDDVLYIVSHDESTPGVIEIGTYPSAIISDNTNAPYYPKVYEYKPLPNYSRNSTPEDYLGPFRTRAFGYNSSSEVDIEIQQSYDASVNIIMTSDGTLPRIVNSRQEFRENDVHVIIRDGNNLDNVYSDYTIDKTLLVPNIKDINPRLDFIGVRKNEGQLLNGGYKYYFKLATADGTESPIIEESRLVSVHEGDDFGDAATFVDMTQTTNAVEFRITGLNKNVYSTVSVYYMLNSGMIYPGAKSFFKVDKAYKIEDDGTCSIVHTGYETQLPVDSSVITASYNPIDSVATLNQKNSRLLLGNIKTTDINNTLMREAALNCYIEPDMDLLHTVRHKTYKNGQNIETYADPYNIYYKVAYFPGETYEFAINFVFENGAVSNAFPIMGFDYLQSDMAPRPMGSWDPSAGQEYPDDPYINDYWSAGNTTDYTFTTGPLAGQTITYTDYMQYTGSTWIITASAVDLITNYLSINTSVLGDTTRSWFDPVRVDDVASPYRIQNTKGVVRLPEKKMRDMAFDGGGNNALDNINVYTVVINLQEMINNFSQELSDLGVVSYFVSRRQRDPDLMAEGVVTAAATAPLSTMPDEESTVCTFGQSQGYGVDGALAKNFIHFPIPGNAMQLSAEAVNKGVEGDSYFTFDGIQFAPLNHLAFARHGAFYTPDITCDAAQASMINIQSDFSVKPESIINSRIDSKTERFISTTGSDTNIAFLSAPASMEASNYEYMGFSIPNLTFVSDGMRSYVAGGFTARLDRQNFMLLRKALYSYSEQGTSKPHDAAEQEEFASQAIPKVDPNGTNSDYGLYVDAKGSYEDIGNNSYTVPEDEEAVYSQLLGSGIKFSPYIGLEFITNNILMDATISNGVWFTAYESSDQQVPAVSDKVPVGVYSYLYNSTNNGPMPMYQWINKYSVSRPSQYFAISRRFKITVNPQESERLLYGGDCYTGFYTQRVWRPAGIDGIPTASNALAYSIEGSSGTDVIYSREGLNITNSGYAITFPVRSKYNFAIRAIENADAYETPSEELMAESSLFGKGRHYPSNYPEDEVHGNRQPETSIINYGNIIETSIMQYQQFDDSIPYSRIEYPNRLLSSEIAVTGEFSNGFRKFMNINFKDYDEELGELTAMVSRGLYTYLVFTKGVSMIEVEERSAISDESGANIYIGSSTVLPPKSTPIFTTIGAQYMRSVVASEGGVFGVDVNVKKVWLVDGASKKVVSDYKVQTLLNDLINDDILDIVSTYDGKTYELTISFYYNDGSIKSLIYNVMSDVWYGTSDINKFWVGMINNEHLSIQKHCDQYAMYKPVLTKFDEITAARTRASANNETKIYNSYFEFVVKYPDLTSFYLTNLVINGLGTPSWIDIFTEVNEQYSIDPAAESVTGMDTAMIPTHTNVYMLDATGTDIERASKFLLIRRNKDQYKTVDIGDKLTVQITDNLGDTKLQQLTVAGVVNDDNLNANIITVDREILDGVADALYYGWKVPIRVSYGQISDSKTSIVIPGRKQADAIAGKQPNPQASYLDMAPAKAYGRWVKVRLNFDGLDPMYIDSIISDTTLRS